ncbi:MAG: protein kinase [Tannerella sp.]|jgi:serine/threonine-protein kinase|nr:protein kinase [Tannerella sp.]
MKKLSVYTVHDTPVGRGGMGQVYRGLDPETGLDVAVKEMRKEFAGDRNLRDRFHREVKILKQITHPYVVKVYDSFETGGNLYLVMEYIEGETVEQHVRQNGAMNEREALRLLCEMLSALAEVHRHRYVHRDVKPGNIMLRPDGHACLLDFGIAKDMNGKDLTTGLITIGTDGYMSPEQAEGLSIDHRSDIYSLGCVLFYMLTGRHAFVRQTNDHATRMAIIRNKFPRAGDFRPDLSDSVQDILDRATHKDMRERFGSCGEFRAALDGRGAAAGKSEDRISAGREKCDVLIPHHLIKVSRHHADITRIVEPEGGVRYLLRDRSSNGTFVNGEMIHHREKEITVRRPAPHAAPSAPEILLAGVVPLDWRKVEEAFRNRANHRPQPATPATPAPAPTGQDADGEDATAWLAAVYIFALLGGLPGLIAGMMVYRRRTTDNDGRKVYKYKPRHRTAALIGAILSAISFTVWILICRTSHGI